MCIEIKRRIGVIIQVHIHLVAHLSIHIEVDFLIEIHCSCATTIERKCRIFQVLMCEPHAQFGRSLRANPHTARTKNLLGRSKIKVHVAEIKLIFPLAHKDFSILFPKEGIPLLMISPPQIFFLRHHQGCP